MNVIFMLDNEPCFECPGCGMYHMVNVNERNSKTGAIWKWNGDMVKPTFTPSINAKFNFQGKTQICHSFVTAGTIRFCVDSTHELSGKTVDLPIAN